MLLTITYEGENTQDIGYLLHKNPYRAQKFTLSSGDAYVFYPEVTDTRTTAALLLDINPIDLARGKLGSAEGGLFDYVNDRPYVASSFLSTAIARIYGTAMTGRCDKRQALADSPLHLTACIHMLPCKNDALAEELFAPLGYTVKMERTVLSERFPWGDSPYVDLTVSGTVKLSELLNHLYVLIPVFDRQKHYFISEAEIDKLLSHGEGWLAGHPAKNKIAYRYFLFKKSYARKVIDRLMEDDAAEEVTETEQTEPSEHHTPLNTQRLEAVKDAVLASGATSVIDMGCGECKLTRMLLTEQQIRKITACDVSVHELEKAKSRLHYDTMQPTLRNKLTLMQASLTYRDKRFEGYDCACIVEVIEHIEPMRLHAFAQIVFGCAAPHTVILTTPNAEYNVHYEFLPEGKLRHSDHRFEWSRAQFHAWAKTICDTYGYSVVHSEIGDTDTEHGAPTQMGVFTKCG